MTRLLFSCLWVFMLFCPVNVSAITLDQLFSKFHKCQFPGFYYAPWDKQPAHPYFFERNLTPYKEAGGLYYFKVKDSLFGLPVSELVVPGTWDFHGVVFDVPLKKAQTGLKRRFGTAFSLSDKSFEGERPALDKVDEDQNKSILYCNEREGGL